MTEVFSNPASSLRNGHAPVEERLGSEFAEHFAAIDAAQVSPEIDINVL